MESALVLPGLPITTVPAHGRWNNFDPWALPMFIQNRLRILPHGSQRQRRQGPFLSLANRRSISILQVGAPPLRMEVSRVTWFICHASFLQVNSMQRKTKLPTASYSSTTRALEGRPPLTLSSKHSYGFMHYTPELLSLRLASTVTARKMLCC